jgi:hypothetical protein
MSIDTRYVSAAVGAAGPVEAAGATWMLHPEQFEASTAAGYPDPFAGYFAGRAGVLGEVDTAIVDSVFAVFAPQIVEAMWESGRLVHGARGGAELYFRQAAEWADKHLAGVDGLDRLAELGERVIAAAPTAALPLFTGWRSLPRVDDPAGHAFQVILILRELRGSIHLAAIAAAGLSAKEAHLLNKGEEYCRFFGWEDPMPEVDHLKGVRDAAEEQTNQRCAAILAAALSPEEAQELTGLVQAVNAHLTN